MKKAKILVPAMGMMLLSTAAAVSGTMAWFTASRSVTVTTTDFAVEAIDGALTAVADNLAGTTANGTGSTVEIKSVNSVQAKLADASYDHVNDNLYTDVPNENDALQPTTYRQISTLTALGDDATHEALWQAGSELSYYAVAFKVTFSYQFKGDNNTRSLFFDTAASSATFAKQNGGSDKLRTYRGFRIAMIQGSEKLVYAPGRGSADKYYANEEAATAAENVAYTYVNSTSTLGNYNLSGATQDIVCPCPTGTNGSADNKLATYAPDRPAQATDHTGRIDYLGQIVKPNNSDTGSLVVKFVAWYEGTDPEVINASAMDKVSTSLKFYIRAVA